ncbi:chloroplast processing peptidase-like isoform X2 [Aristolochia californica]|uniref:chloroplast processing peptidase-like isoform X2 n=1 Tax=Aristolochia californica TaxID=171875 RepID=UPI0035D64A42
MNLVRFSSSFDLLCCRWMPCHELFRYVPFSCFEWAVNGANLTRSLVDQWWPNRGAMKSLAALLMIFTMLAEMREIMSWSMYPSFHKGDKFVVEKVTYCFRSPSVHEIVLFRVPRNIQEREYEKDLFVKRIVATAGDIVESLLLVSGSSGLKNFVVASQVANCPIQECLNRRGRS